MEHNYVFSELDMQLFLEYEVNSARVLVENNLLSKNYFNTAKYASKLDEIIEEGTSIPYSTSLCLEGSLDFVTPHSKFLKSLHCDAYNKLESFKALYSTFENLPVELTSVEFENHLLQDDGPLLTLLKAAKNGYYPSPKLLISLVNCFDLYIQSCGDIALEDVFFPRNSAKRNSAFSKKLASGKRYEIFHDLVVRNRAISKNVTTEEIAEEYFGYSESAETDEYNIFKGFTHENLDSFIRGYYRWLNSNSSTDK